MYENRRAFERFGADMIFWIKESTGDHEFQPFRIKNIGGGGILVNTDHPFTKNADVVLSFELPQYTDLIEAKATVRHVKEGEEGYDIGLEFYEVPSLPISQLIDYLEELFK